MNYADALTVFRQPPPEPPMPRVVSTGSLGLDLSLGTGGWPLGHTSVIYGESWTGKTTLALAAAREMQKLGTVAYLCLDGDFDPDYARAIGADVRHLLVLCDFPGRRSGYPLDFLVVDAMKWAGHADIIAEFQAGHPAVTILATSQTRRDITLGHETPGYLADASVRVKLAHDAAGYWADVTRNTWSPMHQAPNFFVIGPAGIDYPAEVFNAALDAGLVTAQGSWYSMGDRVLGLGHAAAQQALQDEPGLLESIETVVRIRHSIYKAG